MWHLYLAFVKLLYLYSIYFFSRLPQQDRKSASPKQQQTRPVVFTVKIWTTLVDSCGGQNWWYSFSLFLSWGLLTLFIPTPALFLVLLSPSQMLKPAFICSRRWAQTTMEVIFLNHSPQKGSKKYSTAPSKTIYEIFNRNNFFLITLCLKSDWLFTTVV